MVVLYVQETKCPGWLKADNDGRYAEFVQDMFEALYQEKRKVKIDQKDLYSKKHALFPRREEWFKK